VVALHQTLPRWQPGTHPETTPDSLQALRSGTCWKASTTLPRCSPVHGWRTPGSFAPLATRCGRLRSCSASASVTTRPIAEIAAWAGTTSDLGGRWQVQWQVQDSNLRRRKPTDLQSAWSRSAASQPESMNPVDLHKPARRVSAWATEFRASCDKDVTTSAYWILHELRRMCGPSVACGRPLRD